MSCWYLKKCHRNKHNLSHLFILLKGPQPMWKFYFLPGKYNQKFINLQPKWSGPLTPKKGVDMKDIICLCGACSATVSEKNLFVKYGDPESNYFGFCLLFFVWVLFPCGCGGCRFFLCCFHSGTRPKQTLSMYWKSSWVTYFLKNAIIPQCTHFEVSGCL